MTYVYLPQSNTRVFILKHGVDFTSASTDQGSYQLLLTNHTTRFFKPQHIMRVQYMVQVDWLSSSTDDLLCYTPHSDFATLDFCSWTCDSASQLAADQMLSDVDRTALLAPAFFISFEEDVILPDGEVLAELVHENEM